MFITSRQLWPLFIGGLILILAGQARAGELSSVTVNPLTPAAGVQSVYQLEFTTSDTGNGTASGLPIDGQVLLTFPVGFNVSSVLVATMSGNRAVNPTIVSPTELILTRDSTGTAVDTIQSVLVLLANITNSQTASSFTINVETQTADSIQIDTGISAPFLINAGELHHFQFDPILDQIANTQFTINIQAQDRYNNLVNTFVSSANLSDKTGTITPQTTTNFISGLWSGNVRVTQTYSNNTITATSGNAAGTSNTFNIGAGTVHHFTFETINSPQTAGTSFGVTITARDQLGNKATGFTGTVILSDNTSSISPTKSGAFVNGEWSGNVTITKKQSDVYINARNNGSQGNSNLFNVNAAALDHFLVSNIGDQTAGTPFYLHLTALDDYNNIVDTFTGTVNILDQTGTIQPTTSSAFSSGQWSGDVTILATRVNNIITVQRTGGSEMGSSAGFNVNAGALDHFVIGNIGTQTAGVNFSVSITAKDVHNNTITTFGETASLSDVTGTLSPGVTGSFTSGVWNGSVQIAKAQSGVTITAASSGKSTTSNSFTVNAGALNRFTISNISSPQVARQSFSITIRAEDQFGNKRTQFTDFVNLTDETGTLTPGTTSNFSAGEWNGSVVITQSHDDVTITASRSGITGSSNAFNVQHSALDHFEISSISTQAAGEPFIVTVIAQDFDNNTVESFSGTVSMTDLTGTLSPSTSGNFVNGIWSGNVTISNTRTSNRIAVVRTGGSEDGESNSFDVVAGEVDHFRISSITTPKTAGTAFQITITAEDGNNSRVTNFTGTVGLTDLTGTISPKTTGNFIAGVWTGNVNITESITSNKITASGSGRSGESNTFEVLAASVHHYNIATIASPQTAGQNFNISITAKDQYENTVKSFTGTVNLSDPTGSLTPAISGNFSAGVRTQSVQITSAASNVTITATQGSAAGTSNVFNINPGTLNHFSIANVSTQQAGVPFAITVKAEDQFNNIQTQFSGTVTISDETGTITPAISGSFSNGVWTDNVKITQAITGNQITVQRSGGSQIGTSNEFNVISSTVDRFVIATIPTSQVAGQSFPVTITAIDAQGNTVTTFTGTGVLSDETNTVSPTETGSFTAGVWSGNITITKSATANNLTFTSSGKAGSSNDFNVLHAALDHFKFATVSSPQTAGSSFGVDITAQDFYNNTVTAFSSTINLSDVTGTISPTVSGNFSSGHWAGTVTITESGNDNYITANGGGETGSSNSFNVIAGSLAGFSIGQISTQAAGQPFSISVTARDAFGNTRTQFTSTVNISDLTGTVSPVLSGAFIQGQWTGNVVVTSARTANQISVQRTGGSENGTSVPFDVISSTVDHFTINGIADPQTAGTSFSITITAKDAQNNTVTGFTGTGLLTDETGTITPLSTGSFSAGMWTGSVTINKSMLDNNITFTSSGKAGTSNNFDVNHAVLDHFEFTTVGSPQVAGTSFNVQITARDLYGNRVTSYNTTANLLDDTGTISPTVTGNFSTGQWNGLVVITASGTDVQITANGGSKSGTTNSFNVVAANLAKFSIAPISTQAAGQPFSISVTAEDTYGNTRTQYNGSVNISDLTGTIAPTQSGNFANGQWTGNVVITSARNNNQVSVTRVGGTETGQSGLFNVISSNVDHFDISSVTSPKEAGVPFSITFTAKDAQNNTVTNFTGTGEISDETGTITPTVTGAFSNGVWTGNVTITQKMTGNWITITSSGKAGTSNTFTVSPSSLNHFRFAALGSPQTAGTAFPVTIYAEDQYNNQISSFTNTVTLGDNTGTLSPTTTGNFVSGQWSGNVTITKSASDVIITASRSGQTGSTNSFNVIAGALHHFDLASIESQAPGSPFAITITAKDQNNNVRTQFSGTVNISDETGTISPTTSGNFIQGQWTGNVIINQARTANQITVQRTGGSETGQSNEFDVISTAVDHFDISNIGTPRTAGQGFNVTIVARDAQNNIVQSFNGTGALSDETGTLTPNVTGSFSNGSWTGTLTVTKSISSNKISVTSSGRVGTSNIFTVQHGALNHFKFQNVSSPQIAGTNFSITITAEDAYNNTVTSFVSDIDMSDNTLTISPSKSGTFSGGVWTGNVNITKTASDVVITASRTGITGTTNSFNVVANTLHHFYVQPISAQAAGESFAVTVVAQDVHNNTRTQFSGTVNISDLTGTISPIVSNSFIMGQWTGNVVITSAMNNNRITVTRTGGSETGASGLFNVISSNVDHFAISQIASPQEAGQSFALTITAKDAQNNTVVGFNETAVMSDETGTLLPTQTGSFTNGVWTGNVTVTKGFTNNSITVTSSGKAGTSNDFTVVHTDLHHFRFTAVQSPQIAGTPFDILIYAEDQYDNRVTLFTDYVNLSDPTGTLSPVVSGPFVSGSWSGPVTITTRATDVVISASRFGMSGSTNSFNVNAAVLEHFDISSISTQAPGVPFPITITAKDQYGNLRTQFTGTVGIVDQTGTITPIISGAFVQGQWTGNVIVTTALEDNQITVTRSGGSETGTSASFDVVSSAVDHFVFSAISSPQVAGTPFTVTITAKDAQNNTVQSYNGTGVLGDDSDALSPTSTGNFNNGVWVGNIAITKSISSNRITITSSGRIGTSNAFTVSPAELHHFTIAQVSSPQVAGTSFSINLTARDQYENQVTAFTGQANLSNDTGTLTPVQTTAFTSGSWTGTVSITRTATDDNIYASYSGKQGTSNSFNVVAAALHHFTMGTIGTQAAGEAFPLSLTAMDNYNNIRTQFTGTVDISDISGTITPVRSGNFAQGVWTGNVVVTHTQQNNRITITRTGGSETGQSELFNVISSSVDHFDISTISSPKEAGTPFALTIVARDAQNNVVTDFNGIGVLKDETGTISPAQTSNFSNGSWTGNVTITKSLVNNTITFTSSGKAGLSNEFNVVHTDLNHFKVSSITSPQIAGASFLLTITAEDQFNNTVTSYNTFVTLSEQTGTISPSTTTNFTNGVWSSLVSITKAQSDIYITATGSGKSSQSNLFNVVAGSLQSFEIAYLSTQAAGEPFALNVTALDNYGNVATSFSGTVDISDKTGTIDPAISSNFAAGKWTGNVSISQVRTDNEITVKQTGGTRTGVSNKFNVISSNVDHFVINPVSSPQTSGQSFSIIITAKDKDNNTATSFTGTATLSDLSGAIAPTTTSNFVAGVWNGSVAISKSWTDNIITVTSSGKAGNSNTFNVAPGSLDHFRISSIASPQVAGNTFAITVYAEDQYDNTVTGYSGSVQVSDNTNTISPTSSGNFSNGRWTANVFITKSQSDVRINVSGSGKAGQSNSFNITAADLDHFTVASLTTQAAGEPFPITVTALDRYNNIATAFASTVDISDLTNTITPTRSDAFAAGVWKGNVSIKVVREDDRITVRHTGGTKTGESNLFDVISSNVDHFDIAQIPTVQIAGQIFPITVTAKDAESNTVTSFTGTVTLTDLTSTIYPTSTPAFVNGTWTGTVRITKARDVNRITATALGKAGVSNEFKVQHAALDHYAIEAIASPQTAGKGFLMKITAQDAMLNTVENFTTNVTLSDNTGTLSPNTTGNFISGVWSDSVRVTKSQTDVQITATRSGITGVSNRFYVKPNKVHHLTIRDAASGTGQDILDRTLSLDESMKLYAAGYDKYNNYVREVPSNWHVVGTLDQPTPILGEWTIFDPQTPGTSGQIVADSTSLISAATGTITVGAISFVRVLTSPGGNGLELSDTTLTADDEITLYCAGFDERGNYIGDVVGYWKTIGTLQPAIADSSTWIRFNPTKAPRNGKIAVTHSIAKGDTSGVITVKPGRPVSDITLVATPAALTADTTSLASITSGVIFDADANPVAKNTLFTVHTDLGTITTPDASALYPGIQIAANDSGKISFVLKAPSNGGIAHINVSCPDGSATGFVNIPIASLKILTVSSVLPTVSLGQKAVPVNITVKNLGTISIQNLDAELVFTGPPPTSQNWKDDFPKIIRTDTYTTIPAGATRTLSFAVDVSISAHVDTVSIDAIVSGSMNGVTVTDDSADVVDTWIVQQPAQLVIQKISSPQDSVSQGQENVLVSMIVRNMGQAAALVDSDTLHMHLLPQLTDVTSEYDIISLPSNPVTVLGDTTVELRFYVSIMPQATKGNIKVDGRVFGRDKNSEKAISDSSAEDSTQLWVVKEAPLVGVQSVVPSQQEVSQGQQVPWHLMIKAFNEGGTAVRLDSVRSRFLSAGTDVTTEYTLQYENKFIASNTNLLAGKTVDSFRVNVAKTGVTQGPITIMSTIYFTDMGSSKPIIRQVNAGITVKKPAQIQIVRLLPSQPEVTANMAQDWYVTAVLQNNGGSDIRISTHKDSTKLTFSFGENYIIKQPDSLANGGFILSPLETDSLRFLIDGTGMNLYGDVSGIAYMDAIVSGTELLTGTPVQAERKYLDSVKVEEVARAEIVDVKVNAQSFNGRRVNTNQQFKIDVTVKNNGEDALKTTWIGLKSNGPSLTKPLVQPLNLLIKSKQSAVKTLILNAAATPQAGEIFTAYLDSAVAENTNEPGGVEFLPSVDSTETMIIQTPANIEVMNIITPTTIRAGQVGTWPIKAVLKNSGQAGADLMLSTTRLFVEINGNEAVDYRILKPAALVGGGVRLSEAEVDTLIFSVTATGNQSGNVLIKTEIASIDINNQTQTTVPFQKEITILPSAAVRLLSTRIKSLNYDPVDKEIGLVNQGQAFAVVAVVENNSRVQIDSVKAHIATQGGSAIAQQDQVIAAIGYGKSDSLIFNITANSLNDVAERVEFFTVNLVSAKEHSSGAQASLDNTGDVEAAVKIQRAAQLAVHAETGTGDTIFTINQTFDLNVSIANAGKAGVYDKATVRIMAPDNYQIITATDTISGFAEQTIEKNTVATWQIITPASESSLDSIFALITSPFRDMNTQQAAAIVRQQDTLLVNTSATDLIWNTAITSPEGAKDSVLSTQQDFTISSTIQYSDNLDSVNVKLEIPGGYSFRSGYSSQVNKVENLKPVNWNIIAPTRANLNPVYVPITVRALEKGSPPIELIYKDSLKIQTVSRAELKLDIAIPDIQDFNIDEENVLSQNQPFTVRATVSNRGHAGLIGSGKLRLDVGNTGCILDADTLAVQAFMVNEPVEWSLIAPEQVTDVQNMIITIDQRLQDENTNKDAAVVTGEDTKVIAISTQEGGDLTNTIAITEPNGATDRILSTFQQFKVQATVSSSRINNRLATIFVPPGFALAPGVQNPQAVASGLSQKVEWLVIAPTDSASNMELKMVTVGYDASSGEQIVADTARVNVDVVQRANGRLKAAIITPEQAVNSGVVSTSQVFVVDAYLINHGEANFTDTYGLQMSLPTGYTTENLIKTAPVGSHIQWEITAPANARTAANINISLPLSSRPKDENTNAAAFFVPDSSVQSITITTIEKSVLVSVLPNRTPNKVSNGDKAVSMLGLVFDNHEKQSNPVILHGMQVKITDRSGKAISDPRKAISRIAIVDYNHPTFILGQVTSIPEQPEINIVFSTPDTIGAAMTDSLDIVVDIAQQATLKDVMVTIESSDKIDLVEMHTTKRPVIKTPEGNTGTALNLKSDYVVLMAANLEKAFGNYPNPFGTSDRPTTTITYYLKQDADVQISIFTLLGELVWSRSYKSTEPQGQQGSHDVDNAITWDARNDRGAVVLNGIYVAYIKTSYGETAVTKIAVVK
ncbi:hypothetical protein JW960_17135 [candidate division KSB1 bacterium]|nr:hypothetical protein [candidate division KSB1 bacterium]